MYRDVTPAGKWNIKTNVNSESYSPSLLLTDLGSGFNLILLVNSQSQTASTQSMLSPIGSWKWLILSQQQLIFPLPISWSCMSAIFGNCTGSCLCTVPIMGLCLQQISQRGFTRSLALNLVSQLHTIPKLRVRLRITTSGWKHIFGCSVCTNKMIGWICFQWWNLCTITTTTPQLIWLLSLWTMVTTWPSWMFLVLRSPMNPTSGSNRSVMCRRNASTWLSDHRRYQNKHMISGRARTLASILEIWSGSKWPIYWWMSPHQNLQVSVMDLLWSRRNCQTWLTTLNFPCDGEFMMSSMSMSFPKWNLTWSPNVSNLHHLLLR